MSTFSVRARGAFGRAALGKCLAALGIVGLAVMVAPAAVQAGIGASAAPAFPAAVTVGDTSVAASVQVSNQNTAADAGTTNRVCNFGDPLPCPAGQPGITVIPACGELGLFSTCAATGLEPGVFAVAPLGVGELGTTCGGMQFDVTLIDAASGQLRLTPQGGASVYLAGAGAVCRINLTFDVLKMPKLDQNPGVAGVQTVQIVDNTQVNGAISAAARGTSTGTLVQKASPTIATVASPAVAVGGSLTDTATVTGRISPEDSTVTFRLYGPSDTTCSATPIFTSTVPVASNGTATSAAFTPTAPGEYRWVASYSGDANNNTAIGECGDPDEMGVVNRATPAIVTVASPGVALGGAVTDTAFVSGRVNPLPGATVTFRLYSALDLACVEQPLFTSTVPLRDNGSATSGGYAPTFVGTFRWIATYNGDANNAPVSGVCSDSTEQVTITSTPGSGGPIPATE